MNMSYEKAMVLLTEQYCRIFQEEKHPSNAWKILDKEVRPAIPFVGKEYFEQPEGQRVLVYASAENLTWCGDHNPDYLYYCELDGMLRCRKNFEEQGKDKENDEEFPNVHIQPFRDGGLLIATNRIMKNLFHKEYDELPRKFIERICCSNYGKFTILTDKVNKDYASNKAMLQYSQPYVKADIDILNPDIIILPKSMYRKGGQEEFLCEVAKEKKKIEIMQINPTNVNCHIFNNDKSKAGIYDQIQLTEMEEKWKYKLRGFNLEKIMSVYDYIDNDVCGKQ